MEGAKSSELGPSPGSGGLVRQITEDAPMDFFMVGLDVFDKPLPACALADRERETAMYASSRSRRSPADRFTAYIYGHETTIQLPVEKHVYLRVPEAWQVYMTSTHFINGFLDHLVSTLCRRDARAYRATIQATMVWRRHGVGYKPKITIPPTSDSASFLFLRVLCSNAFLYGLLRSKLGSRTTVREFWKNDFYEALFKGPGGKYLLVFRDPRASINRSNVLQDASILGNPKSREWFVVHESTNMVNNKTMVISNLGITSNGWIRITRGQLFDNRARGAAVSHNTYEIIGQVRACGIPLDQVEETKCDDLTIVALDIECQSDTGSFPQYQVAGDLVNYVGLVKYSALDMDTKETHCVCLGNITRDRVLDDGKTVDTAILHVFEHETEVLNYTAQFLNETNTSAIHTYNGNTFDWKYMDGRAVMAGFAQRCSDFEQYYDHVESYHRAHMAYKDLQGQLADLEEAHNEYGQYTKKVFENMQREIYKDINEVLGYGQRTSWREPMPRTVHHGLWGLWPREFEDTPDSVKAHNKGLAFESARAMYDYFHDQPPITYHYMHQLRAMKGALVYKSMGSKAMGENFLMYPDIGRVHIDQFTFFKNSQFRLSDYKLNSVAEEFLKVSKYDMPYKQLFVDYKSGDPDKRRKIADYCVQDCDLLRRLDQHTNVTLTFLFLFKMTLTPLIDVSLRGQQIRVFNCLYRKAVAIGAIFNSKLAHAILQEYQGATVLKPKPGIHGGPKTWVPVLDFQSLYPSIIIAMLFCMMNLVLPNDLAYVLALEKAGKIPPLLRVPIDEKTTYYFSRNPNCIIAPELKRLGDKRKKVKADMKEAGKKKRAVQAKLDLLDLAYLAKKRGQVHDDLEAMSWDTLGNPDEETAARHAELVSTLAERDQHIVNVEARDRDDAAGTNAERAEYARQILVLAHQCTMMNVLQLSIKIVMNSFYGFFGVKEGMMPGMQPIAISTTFHGRDYIQRTKRFLHNLFDTHPDYADLHMDVIYGDTDSVFVKIWPVEGLANAIKIGTDMGARTTRDEFKGLIILEFEKVANPHYAFEEMKCYIQRVWTRPVVDSGYVYISGVAEKRRDNAAYTRKMYHICRDAIIPPIEKGSTSIVFDTIADIENRCATVLATELGKLEDDKIQLEDYVITKSLSRAPEAYKQPVQPHVALALRIKQRIRDREIVRMPPISGDRLPYVVCDHPTSDKIRDKVEDVDYFTAKGTQTIDRNYYAKAATKPITQLYSAIMNVQPFFDATKNAVTFQKLKRSGQRQLDESTLGARTVYFDRLFYSRQCKKRSTRQLTLSGEPIVAIKKKKKKKKLKKKPIKMRSLF